MTSDFCWAYRIQYRIPEEIPLRSLQNSHRIHPCIIPFESIQSPSESRQHPFWKSVLESLKKPCRITLYPFRILIESLIESLQKPLQKRYRTLIESIVVAIEVLKHPYRISTEIRQITLESLEESMQNSPSNPYRHLTESH